jgi:hypothetical protein
VTNSLFTSVEFGRSVQRAAQTGQGFGWESMERFLAVLVCRIANSLFRRGEFVRSVQRAAQTGQGFGWKSVERFPGSPGLPSTSVVRTANSFQQ